MGDYLKVGDPASLRILLSEVPTRVVRGAVQGLLEQYITEYDYQTPEGVLCHIAVCGTGTYLGPPGVTFYVQKECTSECPGWHRYCEVCDGALPGSELEVELLKREIDG